MTVASIGAIYFVWNIRWRGLCMLFDHEHSTRILNEQRDGLGKIDELHRQPVLVVVVLRQDATNRSRDSQHA